MRTSQSTRARATAPAAARQGAQARCSSSRGVRARAAATEETGLIFQPFEAVQDDLATVKSTSMQQSFARVMYHEECEAAMNEQINIEYTISYVYHSLYNYFDRDNVGLPGLAAFFKAASEEERAHAEQLMDYQTRRGGRVKLQAIAAPMMEYDNAEKGEALYAMELALSLEKLNFQKLELLHDVATKHNDAALADFIEGDMLDGQVKSVKEHAIYVSQLRRIGTGLAVYYFDKQIAEQVGEAAA